MDNLLVSTKQVNGCNDDILDILVIPPTVEDTLDIIADSNTISQAIVEGNMLQDKKFLLALLTNSPQVRTVTIFFSPSTLIFSPSLCSPYFILFYCEHCQRID